jgi:hypothetical protein
MKLKTILSLTRAILCHAKHGEEIYYQFEDELVTAEAESVPEATTAGASDGYPGGVSARRESSTIWSCCQH